MELIELLQTVPAAYAGCLFILGLLVGSFLNVVVYRLPIMLQREWTEQCYEFLELENKPGKNSDSSKGNESVESFETFNLQKPDSHCPQCNHKIKPWENIPVFSYIFLGGKCSSCKNKISLRYPGVEFASGLLSACLILIVEPSLLTIALLLMTWSLITLTLIDYDQQLLPDNITLPLLWLGLGVNAIDLGFGVSIQDSVMGAIAGYGSLWLFYWSFKLLTGKEGMGYGDFKLLAALGAWLGWQSLLPIVILSALVAAILGIFLIVFQGRDKAKPMAYGPFLAAAGYLMLIWGEQINHFYNNLFIS